MASNNTLVIRDIKIDRIAKCSWEETLDMRLPFVWYVHRGSYIVHTEIREYQQIEALAHGCNYICTELAS